MSAELWLEPDPVGPDRDGRVSPGSRLPLDEPAIGSVRSAGSTHSCLATLRPG
jgi:hypothetical protein